MIWRSLRNFLRLIDSARACYLSPHRLDVRGSASNITVIALQAANISDKIAYIAPLDNDVWHSSARPFAVRRDRCACHARDVGNVLERGCGPWPKDETRRNRLAGL